MDLDPIHARLQRCQKVHSRFACFQIRVENNGAFRGKRRLTHGHQATTKFRYLNRLMEPEVARGHILKEPLELNLREDVFPTVVGDDNAELASVSAKLPEATSSDKCYVRVYQG